MTYPSDTNQNFAPRMVLIPEIGDLMKKEMKSAQF